MSDPTSPVEHPPPDPARFLTFWQEFEAGDVTPGRVLANLKTGGMPEFLEATATATQQAGADTSEITAVLDAWNSWERGELPPGPVLERLKGAGLPALLERSAAAQKEAFGL